MPRYVPKTYNNKRVLRIILGTVITFALSLVILFLILFFVFQRYVVDGRLEIPWLIEDTFPTPPPVVPEEPEEPDEHVEPDGSGDIDEYGEPDGFGGSGEPVEPDGSGEPDAPDG